MHDSMSKITPSQQSTMASTTETLRQELANQFKTSDFKHGYKYESRKKKPLKNMHGHGIGTATE